MRKLLVIVFLAIFSATLFSFNTYAQECTRNRPTVAISPSAITGPPDTTFFMTATIRNEDTQACGFSSFNIVPSLPTGWTSFIKTSPKSIFPQQSELIEIDIKTPKDATKQEHSIIIVVDSPNHNTPALKNTATALITIKEEPKSCTISVDDIILRKAGTDVQKITFCLKEKIDVDAKISLRGNTEGEVSTQLLIDDKLVDSSVVNVKPDNFATVNFKNSIDTVPFGKSTPNIKIIAKAACSSSEATREKQFTIDVCDPSCLFTTSIAAPLEKQVGQDIVASIYTRNIGNKENLVAIEPAICREGTCVPMVCEVSSVKLQPEESKSYSCRQKVKDTGHHTLETKVFACGKEETQTKVFTGLTSIGESPKPQPSTECKVEPLVEFRCSGSIRQQLFRNSDCSTTWAYSQYCPNGCSKGLCISSGEEVRGFEPVVTINEAFEAKSGSDALLAFEIENLIDSPAKFDIKVSGEAVEWVSVTPSIIIGEKARERITFSASVPDDAKSGDYDFTITVSSGAKSASKSSLIKVEAEEEAQPSVSIEMVVAVIGGLLVVYILLRFLQSKYDKKESF